MRLIDDFAWAVTTIWQEARGESDDGMTAVGEVILTRMKHRVLSDGTVAGTCLRKGQFSGWNGSDPNRIPSARIDTDDPIVQRCIQAWTRAKAGSTIAKGATHYYAPGAMVPKGAKPAWLPDMIQTAVVGRQLFFVPKNLVPKPIGF